MDRKWVGNSACRLYLHAIISNPNLTLEFFQPAGGNLPRYGIKDPQYVEDRSQQVKEQMNAFLSKHLEVMN